MTLSDDQIVSIWGREPRYHAAPIGSTDIAFARAIEAEVRKHDDALILQLVEALEDFDDAGPIGEGWKSAQLLSLLASARARLEGKP